MEKITEELLSNMGFGEYGEEFYKRVELIDMSVDEWAQVIIKRGIDTDDESWDLGYVRSVYGEELDHVYDKVWIKSAQYIHEVEQLLAIFPTR